MKQLTFVSLFAGIGGFDSGLESAGLRGIAQVEKDKHANTILERHWPNVKRFDDVATFKKGRATRGIVPDLICGGFPCQDLSVAGKRAGLTGKRSGLFWEFMRIVGDFSPRWVLIENVDGLLSSNEGRDMSAVVGALAERGYGWAYRVLDSQYFGLAQRRNRVFIVGCLGDMRRAAEVLFEPESMPWNPAPSREKRKDVAGTLGGGSNESRRGFRNDLDTNGAFIPVAPSLDEPLVCPDVCGTIRGDRKVDQNGSGAVPFTMVTVHGTQDPCIDENVAFALGRNHGQENAVAMVLPMLANGAVNANGAGIGKEGDPSFALDSAGAMAVAYAIQERACSENIDNGPGGKGYQSEVAFTMEARHHTQAVAFAQNTRDEVREIGGNIAGALAGQPGMKQQTYAKTRSGVRRLTPVECERLQGFPDRWTEPLSDSARYRVLGNAVSVPVAAWIGRRIIEASK